HTRFSRDWSSDVCYSDLYDADVVEVLIGQMVNLVSGGKPVRMSKRAGTVVTLEDLVEAVGVDAARYELTRYSVDSSIDIDLDLRSEERRAGQGPNTRGVH